MRRIRTLLLLAACWLVQTASAQINMSPYVSEQMVDGLDSNTATLLENKLRTLLSQNGMNSQFGNSRFVLVAGLSVIEKEALTTTPVKIVVHLNLNLAVGDGVDGNCYGSRSVEITGVGQNDNQAVSNAVKKLNGKLEGLGDLLQIAKKRIISYYNTNGDAIIKAATAQMNGGNYDEAIYQLSLIPQECNAYSRAQSTLQSAFKKRVNHNSAKLLNEAKAMWSANPTSENAANIVATLSEIDPSAACYGEAKALMSKIEAQGKLEQQREYNLRNKQLNNAYNLEKARINAVAQVATAYAKSRPKVVYRVYHWW